MEPMKILPASLDLLVFPRRLNIADELLFNVVVKYQFYLNHVFLVAYLSRGK